MTKSIIGHDPERDAHWCKYARIQKCILRDSCVLFLSNLHLFLDRSFSLENEHKSQKYTLKHSYKHFLRSLFAILDASVDLPFAWCVQIIYLKDVRATGNTFQVTYNIFH